jgi:hypothetical protein
MMEISVTFFNNSRAAKENNIRELVLLDGTLLDDCRERQVRRYRRLEHSFFCRDLEFNSDTTTSDFWTVHSHESTAQQLYHAQSRRNLGQSLH